MLDMIVVYMTAVALLGIMCVIKWRWFYLPPAVAIIVALAILPASVISGRLVAQFIVLICVETGITGLSRAIYSSIRGDSFSRLKTKIGQREFLNKEMSGLVNLKKSVDDKAFDIFRIYETTKSMAAMLKVDEIVHLLSVFINEKFDFGKCSVIIFRNSDEESAKGCYIIEKGHAIPGKCSLGDNAFMSSLARFVRARRSRVFILEDDPIRKELGVPDYLKRLEIIPLSVENRLIGVVAISDLARAQEGHFTMLISQTAMELKKTLLYEEVEELSITDGLTEVYRRRFFMEKAEKEVDRAGRMDLKLAIIMLDIDDFKRINDNYGHMVGDIVLRSIAGDIKKTIREIDLLARYGGEEFIILFPDTDKEPAITVAERIRQEIMSKPISAYDESVNVTASIGVSMFPANGKNLEELIESADKALYLSKSKGRNAVSVA